MRTELADKYLKAHGMRVTKGTHITQIFLPYIIMDTAKSVFDRGVGELTLHHLAHKYKNALRKAYYDFFKDFFKPFTQDETDEIIESFDGFESHLADELTLARVAVSNAVDFLPFELQMRIADIYLANIVAQCAGIIYYDSMNPRLPEGLRSNRHIEDFKRYALLVGREYYKSTGYRQTIAADNVPDLDAAMVRLARKMAEFNERI